MIMRTIVVFIMVLSFFILGFYDVAKHNLRTGIASILLGVVQILVFWKGMK